MANDDFYEAWLDAVSRGSRPKLFDLLLRRAGVTLDRALFPLLARVQMLGPIGVTDLAGLVDLNHSTVSRELAKLEQRGLITRRPAPHDHRVKVAEATPQGHETVAAINQARRRLLDEVFEGWSEEEQRVFGQLYRRFSDRMHGLAYPED
ncbi:MarR family winged helix-turn-helix transcriptional regulator [Streptomyces sp. I05A-00742]|uniref:MarR family winged helix-turn-helix transcriptional regulator n=1 Tax=Streptomyces sp. I05A-00742 TaxID=2732853 RepID=UPI0014896D42|nr:MarR family transcriptional regulator [Streptomyces sp. I05A-00742]